MSLITQLRSTLNSGRDACLEEARRRLAAATDLSLNERLVLEELGEPHEWPDRLLDLGARALTLAHDLSAEEWRSSYIVQDAIDPAEPYCGVPNLGLELAVAEQVLDGLDLRVRRVQDLVWDAVISDLSPRVAGYLGRIGRCYVAGFDAEVTILCRAVLDVALRDVLGDGTDARMSMAARTRQAAGEGLLSRESLDALNVVRTRGNAAVHEEPASSDMAAETLALTIKVLQELFGEVE